MWVVLTLFGGTSCNTGCFFVSPVLPCSVSASFLSEVCILLIVFVVFVAFNLVINFLAFGLASIRCWKAVRGCFEACQWGGTVASSLLVGCWLVFIRDQMGFGGDGERRLCL